MPESNKPTRRYENLNLLGQVVFLAGTAIRTTANLIDTAIDKAADLVVETEKAFRQGLDPNIEDAKILDEYTGGADDNETPQDQA